MTGLSPTRARLAQRLTASATQLAPSADAALATLVDGLELFKRATNAGLRMTPGRRRLEMRIHRAFVEDDDVDDDDGHDVDNGMLQMPPDVRRQSQSAAAAAVASDAGCADAAGGTAGGVGDAGDTPWGWDLDDASASVAAASDDDNAVQRASAGAVARIPACFASFGSSATTTAVPQSAGLIAQQPAPPFAKVRRAEDVSSAASSAAGKKPRPTVPTAIGQQLTMANFATTSTTTIKHKNIPIRTVTAPHALPTRLPADEKPAPQPNPSFPCRRGCGRFFSMKGPRGDHEKRCVGPMTASNQKRSIDDSNRESDAGDGTNAHENGNAAGSTDADRGDATGSAGGAEQSSAKPHAKLTKGGIPKMTRGSSHRQRYSLIFRFTLARQARALEAEGCPHAITTVSQRYNIAPSVVQRAKDAEAQIRDALMTTHHEHGMYKGSIMLANSKAGRRMALGGGRSALFPLAEQETFLEFKSMRKRGLRISPRMLRSLMVKHVSKLYGEPARQTFKASKRWLAAYSFRFTLPYRRKSNKKATSASERVPKLKRWHARFRRRLMRGIKREEHQPGATNHRGGKVDVIVSAQGSHRETPSGAVWGSDCGLCAIKNVTVDATLTLSNLLAVVRPLSKRRKSAVALIFLRKAMGILMGKDSSHFSRRTATSARLAEVI